MATGVAEPDIAQQPADAATENPAATADAGGGEGCAGDVELRHPRSRWMRQALRGAADFVALARAADISHVEQHSAPELAVAAKARRRLLLLLCVRACIP